MKTLVKNKVNDKNNREQIEDWLMVLSILKMGTWNVQKYQALINTLLELRGFRKIKTLMRNSKS